MDKDEIANFMLEEYKQIANAYQDLHSQHNELVKNYLTLIAIPFTVLALVVRIFGSVFFEKEGHFSIIFLFLFLFMLALLLIGNSVYHALIRIRKEAILYVKTVNCVRRFFVENSLEVDLKKYLVLPDYDTFPHFNEGKDSRSFWNFRIVQYLNCFILFIILMVFFNIFLRFILGQSIFIVVKSYLEQNYFSLDVSSIFVSLLCSICYFSYISYRRDSILIKRDKNYVPKFPTSFPTKIIGVDLDGVVADLRDEVINRSKKMFHMNIRKGDITAHDLSCVGLKDYQIKYLFTSDIFAHLKPVKGALKALKEIYDMGWQIEIITERFWNKNDWLISKEWLENYRFSWDHLNLVRSNDKADYAKINNISFFVEDRYETARMLSDVCNKVFLLDEPYNQGNLPDNVIRVSSWKEILIHLS